MTTIRVEVVYAEPSQQWLTELAIEKGATIQSALDASGVYERFPQASLAELTVGIWGEPKSRDTLLRDGDRVEFYRPLEMDPRDARRLRATGQATVPDPNESR